VELTTIDYQVRQGVAHVRFARPEGANAVNPAFSRDLRAVMLAAEFDPTVKAVSVTAARACPTWPPTCWSTSTVPSTA
jgi:2-(1,2-epoxy-1,2-dihydrophenyl)acetyl-CoA isomerase